jgi:hypothetical protein
VLQNSTVKANPHVRCWLILAVRLHFGHVTDEPRPLGNDDTAVHFHIVSYLIEHLIARFVLSRIDRLSQLCLQVVPAGKGLAFGAACPFDWLAAPDVCGKVEPLAPDCALCAVYTPATSNVANAELIVSSRFMCGQTPAMLYLESPDASELVRVFASSKSPGCEPALYHFKSE